MQRGRKSVAVLVRIARKFLSMSRYIGRTSVEVYHPNQNLHIRYDFTTNRAQEALETTIIRHHSSRHESIPVDLYPSAIVPGRLSFSISLAFQKRDWRRLFDMERLFFFFSFLLFDMERHM